MDWISLPENTCLSKYNTNNHHDRDPYYINQLDELIIDIDWWNNEVPEKTKQLLQERNISFTLGKVTIPHERQFDQRLIYVYQAYQEAFEYQEWIDYNQVGAIAFKISALEKEKPDWNDISNRLENLLKTYSESPETKFFVRTGSTSGKNTVPIRPCSNAKEILNHLLKNPEIQMREWNNLNDPRTSVSKANSNKDTYIICIPWNDSINQRNEFRLFVANGKIVALSPQRYSECHNYSEEELEAIEHAVLNVNIGFTSIGEANLESPYKSFIIDAWIDFDNKKLHVIEFNCFGDHSGAGSSLFNWIDDHDILYGTDPNLPIQFRFLSVINMSLKSSTRED